MYMDYFEADPSTRTPPIPTVFLDPPGSEAGGAPHFELELHACIRASEDSMTLCKTLASVYLHMPA